MGAPQTCITSSLLFCVVCLLYIVSLQSFFAVWMTAACETWHNGGRHGGRAVGTQQQQQAGLQAAQHFLPCQMYNILGNVMDAFPKHSMEYGRLQAHSRAV